MRHALLSVGFTLFFHDSSRAPSSPETKLPSEGLESRVGADQRELRVGQIRADAGILCLRHLLERLKHTVSAGRLRRAAGTPARGTGELLIGSDSRLRRL